MPTRNPPDEISVDRKSVVGHRQFNENPVPADEHGAITPHLSDAGREETVRPTRGLSVSQRRLLLGIATHATVAGALAADPVLQRRPVEADLDRLADLGLIIRTNKPAAGHVAARSEQLADTMPIVARRRTGLAAGAGIAVVAIAAGTAYVMIAKTSPAAAPFVESHASQAAEAQSSAVDRPIAAAASEPTVAAAPRADIAAAEKTQLARKPATSIAPVPPPVVATGLASDKKPGRVSSPPGDAGDRKPGVSSPTAGEKPILPPRQEKSEPPPGAPPRVDVALQQTRPLTEASNVATTVVKPAEPVRVNAVIDPKSACAKLNYPPAALRAEQTGVVMLNFLVDVDGSVVESKIEHSSGHRVLDEAARSGLSRCHFIPAKVGGQPTQSWAHLEYEWRIE